MSGALLASAALAAAGLLPASANAQVWYSPACIEYFTNYCAANWQALGFASSAQCVEHYKETVCKGYDLSGLSRVAGGGPRRALVSRNPHCSAAISG